MFSVPVVSWIVTALLVLSGMYHLLQAAQSRHITDRVNKGLHFLMNVVMVAMLWNLMASTLLAQITVLTGAAFWFIIQAVARPEFTTLCAGRQGRLKCVYHGLTMAGGAFMVAMMSGSGATGHDAHSPVAAVPSTSAHTHHAVPASTHTGTPTDADAETVMGLVLDPAMLLTVFFTASALGFLILLLRARRTSATKRATPEHTAHSGHAHEALGAALMALMFATMTA